MSIEMMNGAWNTDGLTPTKKLILLLLGAYADENGQCYPSHRHIAKKIGLKDTKGIQRTIKEFEEEGLLRIEHRKTVDGGYTSNKYTLLLPTGKSTPTGVKKVTDPVPVPSNKKDDKKTNILYPEDFEFFWKLYPRRIGKYQAGISFEKALHTVLYDDLIHATKVFVQEMKNTEEKYIVHATTWLNQKRYLDYKDGKIDKPKPLNNIAG